MLNKKMILEKGKKLLAILLTSTMAAVFASDIAGGILQVEAAADSIDKIGLGISDIVNPQGAGKWSYVYFGHYAPGKTDYPLKWRVLKKDATGFASGKTTMFLDCDYVINNSVTFSSDTSKSEWSVSQLRDGCINMATTNTYFSDVQLSHIMPSNISEKDYNPIAGAADMAVNGDKIFIIGANDVTNTSYGYGNDLDPRKKKYINDGYGDTDWWIRTKLKESGTVKVIKADGGFDQFYEPDRSHGISPALNLDVTSIMFTRLVDGNKGYANAAYALMLKDPNLKVEITNTNKDASAINNKVTIPIKLSGSSVNDKTRIYVFATNGEFEPGNLNNAKLESFERADLSADGTATFPEPYWGKHFYLVAVNPSGNTDNEDYTDYVSEPVEIRHIHEWDISLSSEGNAVDAWCGDWSKPGCFTEGNTYTATLNASDKIYDGQAATASVSKDANFPSVISIGQITYKGIGGTAYDSTAAPVNVGKYSASATVICDNDTKTISKSFEIKAKSISGDLITATPSSYEADGKEKAPTITVKDGKNTLVKDKDYIISGTAKATKAGNYSITVTGKGNYVGSASVSWKINEKKTDDDQDKTHKHSLTKTEAKAATASKDGNKEYWTCTDCGKYFSDAAGTKEIPEKSWIIPAHKLVKTEAKAATATKPGNKEYWTCSGCKKYFSDAAGTKEIKKDSWVIPAEGSKSKTPAAKGKTISNSTASYVVTSSSKKSPTVKYKAPKNSKATSVTIPDTVKISGVTYKVTEINAKAFRNKKIKKVKIGKYVTKIGNNAFYGCKYLTTVSGGAAVKSIGASAFYGCVKLKKPPIGAKVTSIGDKAFYDCKAMTTMVIPVNVNKLGALFAGKTPKLKTFTVKTKKLTKKNVKAKALTGMGSKNTVTTVPKGMGKTYKVLFQGKGLNKKIKIKQGK